MTTQYLQDPSLPPSLYESTLTEPRGDHPTLADSVSCDVCVVGGGLTGLHTALNLAERGLQVVLLEARRIGWGASGRNGGHVIPEFACGMRTLEKALGMEAAQRCWSLAHEGADLLRTRISQHAIKCDYQAGHIEAAIRAGHAADLSEWQEHAARHYGYHYRLLSHHELPDFIGSKRYRAGLLDMNGGHLHPLNFTLGLARAFCGAGGRIFEHSPVQSWQSEERGRRVRVQCASGQVEARSLVLAANVGMEAMQGSDAQRLASRILPVGTWIIATEPLSKDLADELLPTRAAVADNRVVLDYFRLSAGRRMVFGGGCSYLGKSTPQGFSDSLRAGMVKVFPQLADTRVDYAWGGVIDISMSRAPDFGQLAENVFYAQGFSGSGLVATAVAGRVMSDAVQGRLHDLVLFKRLNHLPFPGGPLLRAPLTAAGMLYHRLRDWV